jgi:predicted NAD/FAD-binding protein
MKIAVIGSGIAGVSASQLLHHKHDVTLIEKRERLGGHTHTWVLEDGPDAGVGVDTGFIVCNNWTYPNFHRFLDSFGVPVRETCMSFGYYSEDSDLQYAGTDLNGLLAQRSNIFKPSFLRIIKDFIRFNRMGQKMISEDNLPSGSLRDLLNEYNYSQEFIFDYLVPMGGAIWSSSNDDILSFPASLFLRFFKNHGLLNTINRPIWQTVENGSHTYLKAFQKDFKGRILTGVEDTKLQRVGEKWKLESSKLNEEFDAVVFAVHADQVLPLVQDPSEAMVDAFKDWNYLENKVVLHTDTGVLPPNQRAWASWNFVREEGMSQDHPASLTYDMNRLQGLETQEHYLVTLNRIKPIDESKVIKEFTYFHPNFTLDTLASVDKIKALNGAEGCYFAGSYHGFGFHEDACKSSVDMVREHFGLDQF